MNQLVYKIEDWKQDNDSCLLYETLFHNANGYLGVRAGLEEGYPEGYHSVRGSYINGFYDFAEMKQAEKLYGLIEEKQTILNLHDTQGIKLVLDGEVFSMWSGTVLNTYRMVHMEQGFTERFVLWESPGGKRVELRVRRMTSFLRPNLFLIDYQVTPVNFSGEITLVSTHVGTVKNYYNPDDPRVAGENLEHLTISSIEEYDGKSLIVSKTSRSGLSVCSTVMNRVEGEAVKSTEIREGTERESFFLQGEKGHTIRLMKYCIYTDSVRCNDVVKEACDRLNECVNTEIRLLYQEQETYLKEFWERSMLELDGDEELNLALHYNTYQLLQSVGKDDYSNIAAKGLSGEGYEGHYFWDTEMYIQPFFVLTNPEISKKLIEFRYRTLKEAKENAALLGHKKGAAFPWRTIMGKECSGYYPSGSAAYHISADIAYSVITYYLTTGDLTFIASKGAELVFETARLWADLGAWVDGEFHIQDVTGPDEYTCLVNNNYFTNVSAKYNLIWACKFYQLLKEKGSLNYVCQQTGIAEEEIAEFAKIAEHIYLPYDAKLDMNPQDDSFLKKKVWDFEHTPKENYPLLLHYHPMHLYRHQVCKQADTVLAHFLFEEEEKLSTIRNSFQYYEQVTTHDSSLSACTFSIMASRLDLQKQAYDYFGNSALLDLFNTHGNTKDGIHTANMGGTYMAIVYGFGGLRIKESGISFAPALPAKWSGYHFRIGYHGSVIEVNITKEGCEFRLVCGEFRKIWVFGKEYRLEDSVVITRKENEWRAVIFDLDGVITDSARYHFEAWGRIAKELEIPFDASYNEKLKGISRMDSLDLLLKNDIKNRNFSEEDKKELAGRKNEYYQELIDQITPKDILPGICNFIQELKQERIKLGLASVSYSARLVLKRIGLEDDFDYIADAGQIRHSKPYPDIFLDCADGLGVNPSACIGIEDAKSGIEAIKRAGMKAVGVGCREEMGQADVIAETKDLTVCLMRSLYNNI